MANVQRSWAERNQAALSGVHPELRRRVENLIADMAGQGYPLLVVCGIRTWEEQDALYRQVPKVTNARGGWSMHNFGLAVDIVPDDVEVAGLQPDWRKDKLDAWEPLLRTASKYQLAEGALWRSMVDLPHFYLYELPANPTDFMRAKYKVDGIDGVWGWVDDVLRYRKKPERV